MSWVDAVAAGLEACRVHRWGRAAGPLIVMYHGIGGADGVAPDAFRAQLDLLSARRRVVPLHEAVGLLGTAEAARIAAISFDDGYRDFAQLAVPILCERGLHATVFVPAGHLGGDNAWDAGRASRRTLMSASELRELEPAVVEVGAHGLSHCRMRGLTPEALHDETSRAREILAEACGRPPRHFAYPYGQGDDFDAAAERAVERAGFESACSTRFGRGSRPDERYRLRRVGIEPGDSTEVVARKLDGAYDWVRHKEALGLRVRGLRGASSA